VEHWFDNLTRVTLTAQSRRDVFRGVISIAAAAVTRPLHAYAADKQSNSKRGRCSIGGDADHRVIKFSTARKIHRDTISIDRTITLEQQRVAEKTRINHSTLGPIVEITTTGGQGESVRIRVIFGPSVSGIKEMSLVSEDGQRFTGDIDGRDLAPFSMTQTQQVRFADGTLPPTNIYPAGVEAAIQALSETARKELRSCIRSDRENISPTNLASVSGWSSSAAAFGCPHEMEYYSNPKQHVDCKNCIVECYGEAAACAAAACIVIPFVGCAIGSDIGCSGNDIRCLKACNNVGGDCCPIGCGHGCCESRGQCLDPNRGVCCGPDETPCHGRTCCDSPDACLPDGTCCAEGIACGNTCCAGFTPCCGDQCCATACCNGRCCNPGQSCHPTLQICCSVPCGPQCCLEGQVCSDPQRGICAVPERQLCGDLAHNRVFYCQPLEVCCGGKCCPPNFTCCDAANQICAVVCLH